MTLNDANRAWGMSNPGVFTPMGWLRTAARGVIQTSAMAMAVAGLTLAAPALANETTAVPDFFSIAQKPKTVPEPRLAAAPDVVKAFGLDRSPELFRTPSTKTPDLPKLAGYLAAPDFPDRPYIPDLFGAEKCPERGPGFYRLRGTSSCIHVGGRVGAGVQIGGRGNSGAFTYGRIQADVVTPTEIGDLTLTMAVQGAMTNINNGPIYVGPRNRGIP